MQGFSDRLLITKGTLKRATSQRDYMYGRVVIERAVIAVQAKEIPIGERDMIKGAWEGAINDRLSVSVFYNIQYCQFARASDRNVGAGVQAIPGT